jgi:transposase-like protein
MVYIASLNNNIGKEATKLEEATRQKAIQRYLKGEKPRTIYTELDRSKHWFFKWLKRYRSGEENWFKDQSRKPKSNPNRTSEINRDRVIQTRKRLESESFAQIGASAIKWELTKSGDAFSSDSTINRILRSEGLVKKNSLHS